MTVITMPIWALCLLLGGGAGTAAFLGLLLGCCLRRAGKENGGGD